MDNYQKQAESAKAHFLSYDQAALIAKWDLDYDENYLYLPFAGRTYRLDRKTGDLTKKVNGSWVSGNTHSEVMTLLDLLCDSADDRYLAGRWQSMEQFGHAFHRALLDTPGESTVLFDQDPDRLRRGCRALGGIPEGKADIGFRLELIPGFPVLLQFWHSDDEFKPQLRLLWDENSMQYLRYETMFFAADLLIQRILEEG